MTHPYETTHQHRLDREALDKIVTGVVRAAVSPGRRTPKDHRDLKVTALELVLPLLRQQLREIVESCLEPTYFGDGELAYIRRPLTMEERKWFAPWRKAVGTVETALGLPPGPEDGGIRYYDK